MATPAPGPVAVLTSPMTSDAPAYAAEGTLSPDGSGAALVAATLSLNGGQPVPLNLAAGGFSAALLLRPGTNTLDVVASDATGHTTTAAFPVVYRTGLPSSAERIATALEAGTLTTEQALSYRVYAAFGDARLPSEFRGDDSRGEYHGVLAEAAGAAAGFSDAAKRELGPFLAPPMYLPAPTQRSATLSLGRALDASPCIPNPLTSTQCPLHLSWIYLGGAKVKIWYPAAAAATDLPKAQVILDTLEGPLDAANRLERLMGHGPIPDSGGLFDGGDARLDIVLVPTLASGEGMAVPSSAGGQFRGGQTSSYVLLPEWLDATALQANAVHEYMHVLQWSRRFAWDGGLMAHYRTLAEASAQWAMYYVLVPHANYHFREANRYAFSELGKGLLRGTTDKSSKMAYGAWLFLAYLQGWTTMGDRAIPLLWDATKSDGEAEAIRKVVESEGFPMDFRWKEFVSSLYGRGLGLFEFAYGGAVGPTEGAQAIWFDVDPRNGGIDDTTFETPLPPLSAVWYGFHFPVDEARSVYFADGIRQKLRLDLLVDGSNFLNASSVTFDPAAGVQVYVHQGKVWTSRPYSMVNTGLNGLHWCRDRRAERIQDLMLIFSNSSTVPGHTIARAGGPSVLRAANIGCQGWTGTVAVSGTGWPAGVAETTTYALQLSHGPGEDDWNFNAATGSTTWSLTGDDGKCAYSGNATLAQMAGTVYFHGPQYTSGPSARAFTGAVSASGQTVGYLKTCRPPNEASSGSFIWQGGRSGGFPVEGGGDPMATVGADGTATGFYDATLFDSYTMTWQLAPIREP